MFMPVVARSGDSSRVCWMFSLASAGLEVSPDRVVMFCVLLGAGNVDGLAVMRKM